MQRTKVTCQYCDKEISKSNITRHEESCKNKTKKISYALTHDGLTCQFCSKECKNRNSLCNHERMCKLNPNRQINVGFDKFNADRKVGKITSWNTGLSAINDERVRKQSESLRDWYADHPEHNHGGYIPTSARNVKYGTYKGYFCDSSWELAFLIYHLDHNIAITRCTECFNYTFNGKVHKYYPDFIIGDTYYEIKGRCTDRDIAKFKQFPSSKSLYVVDQTTIYKYLSYCKSTYGAKYAELYDPAFPSWINSGRRYLKDDQ